jgi:hypothetical protein
MAVDVLFKAYPMVWYHSHADPIWPDGTFKSGQMVLNKKLNLLQTFMILGYHLPVKSYISSSYNQNYAAHIK